MTTAHDFHGDPVPCPDCHGRGYVTPIVGHSPLRYGCSRCRGMKLVPAAMLEWMEAGKCMGADRRRRGLSESQEARRLGITLNVYLDCQGGHRAPPPAWVEEQGANLGCGI
jgi:hypothetical protein